MLGFGTTAESELHRDKGLRDLITAQQSSCFAAIATILFFFAVFHGSIVLAYQPFYDCLVISARYVSDEVCRNHTPQPTQRGLQPCSVDACANTNQTA